MQTWCGKAIRSNVSTSVYAMKKAIGAILYHCIESENDKQRHIIGPDGANSWCHFKRSRVNRKPPGKNGINLHEWMLPMLTPLFPELSDDLISEKCMHAWRKAERQCDV
jgi:hypothetical protein